MNINKGTVKALLHDQSWKAPAIAAALALLVLILLDSVLFALGIALLKIGLAIFAVFAIIRALILGWPALARKIEEK